MPFKPLLLTVLLCCSPTAFAAPEPAPANTSGAGSDLQEIRRAISAAQADLKRKQAAQQSARKTLEHTRTALADAQQELAAVNKQHRDAWAKMQTLQNELNRLKTEVTGTKAQVARLLSGQYKNRHPNAVVLFLKNAEPGQKARYLQYSRYINEANQKVMNDLVRQQADLEKQEAAINAELARLNKIKVQRQAAMGRLGRANTAAQTESRRLSAQIDSQTQHIASLRENEQRLNALLADIAKRNAENRRKEAEARKKAAQARLAAAEKARAEKEKIKGKAKPAQQKDGKPTQTAKTPAPKPQTPRSTLTAEDRALQAPDQTTEYKNSFSRMQGRLSRPVGGTISGRFGQARPSGGTWKGVFFSTAGAPVQSIAAGTVAYAGPLSGYGNMVVLDHGDGYVSVYSGLSSVSVGGGASVAAGRTIGTSGRLPSGEQGLYFEIRYRRQPMNPLSWIR
ncbi:murein hydrolase activator EnvC [Neisseria sp.]|uniref:murein hydrolase activator EnvC family protein n=1 Tax=Neisseria sp. TaxID=192066 RepID=UPI0026DCC05B|nr:peptidoglycan DD-metalloendopeptidase family protein [Neisseria sp.]MDO4906188.1 peptidoglycan DD-metalloendopeptidase family protein [Neisseria sp.]